MLDIDSSILPSSITDDDSSYNNCVDMNEENNSHENSKQCRLHLSTTNLQLTDNDDTPPTSDEDDVLEDEDEESEPDEEEGNLLLQELGVDNYSDEESLEYITKTNDSTLYSNYSDSEEEEESDCSTSDEQDELLEESEEEEEDEKPFTEDELQDYLQNMCDSRRESNYVVQPSSLLASVEQPQQLDSEEESDIDDEEENIDEEEENIDDEDEYYTDRSSQETESVTSTTAYGTPLKLSQVSSTSANNNDDKPDHELFLPLFCSPHTERLNIPDEGDGLSDYDESDYFYSSRTVYGSGARTGGYGNSNNPYLDRTYMFGNRIVAPTRPRLWDGYGCNHHYQQQQRQLEDQNSPTVSDSSEEDNLSQASVDSSSSSPNKDDNTEDLGGGKQSVSFDTSVTVYPIYETSQYSSDMVQQMYTNREELRINKLRNKREYAHDSFNWRDVTEEDGMTVDDTSGELVHPVHTVADVKRNKKKPLGSNIKVTTAHGPGPSIRNVVRQTYSSALGGYTSMTMGGGGHRTKRMRMCW